MRLYAERRFDAARRKLIDARARGADSVLTSFFVACCS